MYSVKTKFIVYAHEITTNFVYPIKYFVKFALDKKRVRTRI